MKDLGLQVSDKKNFEVCLLCSNIQNCDPWGRTSFDPRGIIGSKLVEVHKEMLFTKYESSRLSSLREEEF